MRIVVFSDSHGDYQALWRIVKSQPEAEVFLHLGDGEQELEDLRFEFPEKLMYAVSGNCDWGSVADRTALVTLGGKRIFMAHGHTLSVKAGLAELLFAARQAKAHVALYGHTHISHTVYRDGVYVMNPGSVSFPRDGSDVSYGIIDITEAGIVTGIVRCR